MIINKTVSSKKTSINIISYIQIESQKPLTFLIRTEYLNLNQNEELIYKLAYLLYYRITRT